MFQLKRDQPQIDGPKTSDYPVDQWKIQDVSDMTGVNEGDSVYPNVWVYGDGFNAPSLEDHVVYEPASPNIATYVVTGGVLNASVDLVQ